MALKRGFVKPLYLNLAAWRREEERDYAGAHALLLRALRLAPDDVLIVAAIGSVLRKEGKLDEALLVLNEVVAKQPRHAAAWLERGYTLDALRSTADARESYTRALKLDPKLAPAWGKLADAAAREGNSKEGRELAERSLAINPAEPSAIFALATIEIEARDGAASEKRLRAALESGLRGDDRTRALTLLGDSLDRQDRTTVAFASWAAAQTNFRSVYAGLLEPSFKRTSHRSFIEAIAAQVREGTAKACVGEVPDAAATHIFLLGYPRSGTTLVENILASAPGVVALEERDTMADIDTALIDNDGSMPKLDSLDPVVVDDLRRTYWRTVTKLADSVVGKTFVDMNPLNAIKLPVIARLFPDARILVMRRDPRDVVLSCFRINFTPSPAAWAFSDLDETARHYRALMTLTERCMSLLPLQFHIVRYDKLVTDFEPTVRAIAAFCELEWTDTFLKFDRTAQKRGVRTASATQVRRGLYDGRGQWRRYVDQLSPILSLLQPWVERFGFDH